MRLMVEGVDQRPPHGHLEGQCRPGRRHHFHLQQRKRYSHRNPFEEKIYIPEMIFGHLLTSSNYDDDEKKLTGGRNGYGAKLTNIYSTEFTIETADKKTDQKYKQTWSDNMTKAGKAKITKNSRKGGVHQSDVQARFQAVRVWTGWTMMRSPC